ncbi:MAG: PHP domain-containing protein [Ruminococcaceae bacterium]|nr:PHP domain-containing protein [Oscillospiraceae bacterium]
MPKYDLHIHTRLSSCANPEVTAADYIACAKERGVTTIAFTDHMWDSAIPGASNWYKPQNYEHICELKKELPAADPDLKILFGCECECDKYGVVGISEEVAAQLDILLVPHSHTHMKDFTIPAELREDDAVHGRYLVDHFMHIIHSPVAKYVTVIPHPFAAVGCPTAQNVLNSIPDSALQECCAAAKENNIALEINTSCFTRMDEEQMRNCAYLRLFEIARQTGCRFTIGSDAHSVPGMDALPKGELFARIAGITEDMFLTV